MKKIIRVKAELILKKNTMMNAEISEIKNSIKKSYLLQDLRYLEIELSNLSKRIPAYDQSKSIKTQLEDLLDAYGVYKAVKVVEKRCNPTKTEYRFELRKSHKILKIFSKDLGNRKLFNQAKHYLNFLSNYDTVLIERELELISFCIPEDTEIEYSIKYRGSEIDSISFTNVASNIYDMQYIDGLKQLVFKMNERPNIQCSIEVRCHEDLFSIIRHCQFLAKNL